MSNIQVNASCSERHLNNSHCLRTETVKQYALQGIQILLMKKKKKQAKRWFDVCPHLHLPELFSQTRVSRPYWLWPILRKLWEKYLSTTHNYFILSSSQTINSCSFFCEYCHVVLCTYFRKLLKIDLPCFACTFVGEDVNSAAASAPFVTSVNLKLRGAAVPRRCCMVLYFDNTGRKIVR